MSVESYKHKAAKDVLKSWIETKRDLLYRATGTYREIMYWELNSRKRMEVAIEFPLTPSNTLAFHRGTYVVAWWEHGIPTYEMLKRHNEPAHAILDLAVGFGDIGSVEAAYGFEVVHSNPVSAAKARLLDSLHLTTCELDADWILSQVGVPEALRIRNIYGYGFWDELREADRQRAVGLGGARPRP